MLLWICRCYSLAWLTEWFLDEQRNNIFALCSLQDMNLPVPMTLRKRWSLLPCNCVVELECVRGRHWWWVVQSFNRVSATKPDPTFRKGRTAHADSTNKHKRIHTNMMLLHFILGPLLRWYGMAASLNGRKLKSHPWHEIFLCKRIFVVESLAQESVLIGIVWFQTDRPPILRILGKLARFSLCSHVRKIGVGR